MLVACFQSWQPLLVKTTSVVETCLRVLATWMTKNSVSMNWMFKSRPIFELEKRTLRARKRTSLSTERFQRDFSKTTCFGSIIPTKCSAVVLSSSRVVADGRIMQNRLFSWIIITLVRFSTWSVLTISSVFVHSPWESLIDELSRVTDELFFLLRAHFRISITLLVKPKKKALRSVLWKTNGLDWKLLKFGL